MKKEFLSIKEAAQVLGVSALTLRNWDKSGKFTASRHPINNYRVYKTAEIEMFLEDINSKSWNTKKGRSQQTPARPVAPHTRSSAPQKLSVKHLAE